MVLTGVAITIAAWNAPERVEPSDAAAETDYWGETLPESLDTLTIDGDARWTSSGVECRNGGIVHVGTTGGMDNGDDTFIDADGVVDGPTPGEVIPGANQGALIGSVGDGPPFVIGRESIFECPAAGPLNLRTNGAAPGWTGEFTVAIEDLTGGPDSASDVTPLSATVLTDQFDEAWMADDDDALAWTPSGVLCHDGDSYLIEVTDRVGFDEDHPGTLTAFTTTLDGTIGGFVGADFEEDVSEIVYVGGSAADGSAIYVCPEDGNLMLNASIRTTDESTGRFTVTLTKRSSGAF